MPLGAQWTAVCNQKESGEEKKTTFSLLPEQTSSFHHSLLLLYAELGEFSYFCTVKQGLSWCNGNGKKTEFCILKCGDLSQVSVQCHLCLRVLFLLCPEKRRPRNRLAGLMKLDTGLISLLCCCLGGMSPASVVWFCFQASLLS